MFIKARMFKPCTMLIKSTSAPLLANPCCVQGFFLNYVPDTNVGNIKNIKYEFKNKMSEM